MSKSSTEDMSLSSILNMEHLYEGGLKTEYGLYAVSNIVEKGGTMYAADALDILGNLSKKNLAQLNKDNKTEQANQRIILDVMFEVANHIIEREPKLTPACCKVMKEAEENNKDIDLEMCETRPEFMKNVSFYIQKEMKVRNR